MATTTTRARARHARAPIAALLTSVVLLGGGAFPAATAPEAIDYAAIDAHVRSAMEASAIPGVAYGIVRDGDVVHLAAFGSAGPGDRAMTPQTPMLIGSVGKSITALAVRQLVEAGQIELDAPVARYLPWFTLADAVSTEAVTIDSLLRHTSGLSTWDGQDPDRYAPGRTAEELVRGLASVTGQGAGTYAYSNLNHVILGLVIEAVSGQRYEDYVAARIFGPLGMAGSSAASVPPGPDLATGHRYLFGVPVPYVEPFPTGMVAAGYHVSTAEDLARFTAALSNGGAHGGVDIVGSSAAAAGERTYSTDWQPLSASAGTASSQSGATLAFNADIVAMPVEHLGVVVLTNANPTQLLGLPAGAATIALDVLRLVQGQQAADGAPSVRMVYVVIDAAVLVLIGAFLVHAARARTWRRRLERTHHRALYLGRAIVADALGPLAVLVGLPLLIGASGSSAPGDLLGGWRFLAWTLPDVAAVLLALATGAAVLGVLKLIALRVPPPTARDRLSGDPTMGSASVA